MGNTVAPSVNLPSIPTQPQPAEASPLQPGYRLVPAKIGRTNATSVIVWIQCPTWCTEDHVAEGQVAVEDITHYSDASSVSTCSFVKRGIVHDLYASVQADPAANDPRLKAAHVVVDDGGAEMAHLTPEMTEKLADELIGFASELRHLARTARQANRAERGA